MTTKRPRFRSASPPPPASAHPDHAGARWEQLALDHLADHGLTLVARNYRCRLGEIDLLMRDGAVLVVVEVRYRRTDAFGGGAASVGARKQRRLALAARHYLSGLGGTPPPVRFDVVLMSGPGDAPRIEWLRHAFDATS